MGFRRIILSLAAATAILLAGCASPSGPTVKPEDLLLTAAVRPADPTVCLPDVRWVLEVELDRARTVPLHVVDGPYKSEVNVFNGERPLNIGDIRDGCDQHLRMETYEGLSLGNDWRTWTLATEAAYRSGDLREATWPVIKMDGSGLIYWGTEFPIKVRYYLDGTEPPSHRIAVVYAHYEKRYGRDLSWTKTVYATLPER